ncbi:MAG: hypothetical protein AAGF07_01430 [Patescibacteria group bacterium]
MFTENSPSILKAQSKERKIVDETDLSAYLHHQGLFQPTTKNRQDRSSDYQKERLQKLKHSNTNKTGWLTKISTKIMREVVGLDKKSNSYNYSHPYLPYSYKAREIDFRKRKETFYAAQIENKHLEVLLNNAKKMKLSLPVGLSSKSLYNPKSYRQLFKVISYLNPYSQDEILFLKVLAHSLYEQSRSKNDQAI